MDRKTRTERSPLFRTAKAPVKKAMTEEMTDTAPNILIIKPEVKSESFTERI